MRIYGDHLGHIVEFSLPLKKAQIVYNFGKIGVETISRCLSVCLFSVNHQTINSSFMTLYARKTVNEKISRFITNHFVKYIFWVFNSELNP